MIYFFILLSGLAWAMPELKLKNDWKTCAVDADCVVAGDACRSCGKLQFVNKKFKEAVISSDALERKETRACEACQTSSIKIVCLNKVCAEAPKSSGK